MSFHSVSRGAGCCMCNAAGVTTLGRRAAAQMSGFVERRLEFHGMARVVVAAVGLLLAALAAGRGVSMLVAVRLT